MTPRHHISEAAVVSGLGCCTVTGDLPTRLYQQVCAKVPVASYLRQLPWPVDLPRGVEPEGGSASTEELLTLAQVPGPLPEQIAGLRRPFPDRPTLMAIVAADRALADSALLGSEQTTSNRPSLDRARIGVVVGTCFGPSHTVERYLRTLITDGPAQVSPIAFSRAVASSLVGEICRRHQLKGPSTVVLGASILGYALDLLRQGAADAVLCVGVDEVRDLHGWAYQRTGLLLDGLILGEGAAALLLERSSHLEQRNGVALAQVVDYTAGFCPSSVNRLSQVSLNSLESSMSGLLEVTGQPAKSVGLVVGLANGDDKLRKTEQAAVRLCMSPEAELLWPKDTLGETFGASEIIGALVGTLALRNQTEHARPGRCVVVNTAQVGGMVGSVLLRAVPVGVNEVQLGA